MLQCVVAKRPAEESRGSGLDGMKTLYAPCRRVCHKPDAQARNQHKPDAQAREELVMCELSLACASGLWPTFSPPLGAQVREEIHYFLIGQLIQNAFGHERRV